MKLTKFYFILLADYQKCVSTRQQLESQLSENNGVKEVFCYCLAFIYVIA